MALYTNTRSSKRNELNPLNWIVKLKCLQVNLQHSREATSNLTQVIQQYNIDIAFVQEPYTVHNRVAGFPKGLKILTQGEGRNRAAILINNSEVDAITITQGSYEDAVLTEIRYKGLSLYGASIYMPIDRDINIDLNMVENIIQYTTGKGLIIAMDSNARSKLWYDKQTNSRGRTLEEYIIAKDLHIINTETGIPTFETNRGRSWIDLTLCNGKTALITERWTCGEEESCADHKIISFNIVSKESGGNTTQFSRKRYKTKVDKWGTFEHKLVHNLTETFECWTTNDTECDNALSQKVKQCTDIGEATHKFTSAIQAACDATFQVLRPGKRAIRERSVPWWSSELSVLRKRALAMRRRYQRTKNDADRRQERRQQYQESNRAYQAKLREAKISSWKEYCSSTQSPNPWNSVYRYAAGKLRSPQTWSTLKTNNDTYTDDIRSTINQMMDHFIPADTESNDGAHHRRARQTMDEPIQTNEDIPFTKQEVQAALEKFNPRKAPGEDALTSEILLQVFKRIPNFFTEIYNECLRRGHFPTCWKRSIIIPIMKPGKEGVNEVHKYRPISLINTGGKLLEKLLIERINYHLHSNNLLNNNQYGFIPQKSTIDAALALKQHALSYIRQRNYVIMVSLDVQGAFDAAWWPGILSNLRATKCPRNLYNLTRSYFSERVAILQTNTYRAERRVTKGCPQGSSCGPGFWNVLYNDLLNKKYSSHTKLIAFADDLAILTYGKTLSEAEAYANSDLAVIENWAWENKMRFNENKSKAMIIARKKGREEIKIFLNDRKLEQINAIKYLGIYFDRRLTFYKHIEQIADKSRALTYMLNRTAKLHWGLGHKSLKTIYEGAIAPLMTYGAPVWGGAISNAKCLNKLQSAQRLINIKIAKAYRTISFEASCVMAGVPPIGIVINGRMQLYKCKNGQQNNGIEYDVPLPLKEWPHPANKVTIMEPETNKTYPLEIYTDGSKDANSVGAGVAIYQRKQLTKQNKYRLRGYCTNNQAEQIAILKALELLQEMETPTDKEIVIYTDSKVTLDSLKKHTKHGFIIEKIRDKIRQLTDQNWAIHFKWVKAHIGTEGNETADRLAKEAGKEDENQHVVYSRVPISAVASDITKKGHELWQQQWDTTVKGAECRTFFPRLEQRLKMRIPVTPEFTALVTGHGKTKSYLHRFKLEEDPRCPCNEGLQTPTHIIYDCNIVEAQRSYLMKQIMLSGGTWPTAKEELTSKYLKVFISFVKLIDFEKLK
jgi:ribonuclease HI